MSKRAKLRVLPKQPEAATWRLDETELIALRACMAEKQAAEARANGVVMRAAARLGLQIGPNANFNIDFETGVLKRAEAAAQAAPPPAAEAPAPPKA